MIWKRDYTIGQLNKASENTLLSHLGIELITIGEDFLEARMPVDHRTKQPMGLLHGGASVALAESMGSLAALLCIEEGEKKAPVGVEINANHVRSVTQGWVTARITPLKLGRTMQVWQIKIYDDQQRLVCVSRLTIAIVDQR
jgi:1,4-dihydroxy-2-naphthoyl-CoA hydrolase